MPFEAINAKRHIILPKNFKIIRNGKIGELLDQCDLIIYSQTTVALEALMLGIPAIYVDINKFYNCDPLFNCNYLKWNIRNKRDLLNAIDEIYNMSDSNFQEQQNLARKSIENYFHIVTNEKMDEFLRK